MNKKLYKFMMRSFIALLVLMFAFLFFNTWFWTGMSFRDQSEIILEANYYKELLNVFFDLLLSSWVGISIFIIISCMSVLKVFDKGNKTESKHV